MTLKHSYKESQTAEALPVPGLEKGRSPANVRSIRTTIFKCKSDRRKVNVSAVYEARVQSIVAKGCQDPQDSSFIDWRVGIIK